MTKENRSMLQRLMDACNKMGSQLDYTATTNAKLVDRQRCHGKVSNAIYHILCDHPNNEDRDLDRKEAEDYIKEVEAIASKQYTDRNGH